MLRRNVNRVELRGRADHEHSQRQLAGRLDVPQPQVARHNRPALRFSATGL
jgi:hypothetical protein